MDAISCLAPPAALLTSSFADAALARALHFSAMAPSDLSATAMPPDSSASSSSDYSSSSQHQHNQHQHQHQHQQLLLPCADHQLMLIHPPVVTGDSVVLVAGGERRSSSSSSHHLAPASAGIGRIEKGQKKGKRRSRASKRAPTTYISTDPSNFRLMVQHITGADQSSSESSSQLELGLPLPLPLAADHNLLLADPHPLLLKDKDHHHHEQHEQPPCFPTLDSWNVTSMYHTRNDILL